MFGAGASVPAAVTHRARTPWHRHRIRLALGGAALLAVTGGILLVVAGSGQPTLVLRDGVTGEALHHRQVAIGERFDLQHTHSVTRRPVVETFGVDQTPGLTLEGMVFDQPGPNLPSGPERFGDTMTTFATVDGVYRVDHHGYPIGRVTIRVGAPTVDHMLSFEDGTTLRFLELAAAGGAIEMEVVTTSRRGSSG